MGVSAGLGRLDENGPIHLECGPPVSGLTISDFAGLIGESVSNIDFDTRKFLTDFDFRYAPVEQGEEESIILKILKSLNSKKFSVVGSERYEVWNSAWEKTSQRFSNDNHAGRSLTPDFLDAHPILRLNRKFIRPFDPSFEGNVFSVLRHWLYQQYFAPIQTIYEFGCGSGFNLVALAEMFPDKTLFGLDWAKSSVDLVNKIGAVKELRLTGQQFDFFSPDHSLSLEKNSAVLTVCALEQIGKDYQPFMQYLREQKPQLCVHVEPIYELYDEDNLLDYLAMRYHSDRGYLGGFLPYLQNLEVHQEVEIIKVKRMYFGSLYHEGYTCVIWKPL